MSHLLQVMVFPGLSPSHEAFLTAAEFETQELEEPVQLRLQVYRPSREAGGALKGKGIGGLVGCLNFLMPSDSSLRVE